MRFHVAHQTCYRYTRPVDLGPTTIRLQPRTDFRQRLGSYSLHVEPSPTRLWQALDFSGNQVTYALFQKQTSSLTVLTSFTAETIDFNPFAFLLVDEAMCLPLVATRQERPFFEVYARPSHSSGALEQLACRIAREVNFETVSYISRVNQWIHENHANVTRHDGPPWEPSHTLQERCGACRDLAVLLIELCRLMNIPARFVSGYSANAEVESVKHELHAWAEVYLPGAGWRGFDASSGLAITDAYLTVAAGPTPDDAAPVSGNFHGEAASELKAQVEVQAV